MNNISLTSSLSLCLSLSVSSMPTKVTLHRQRQNSQTPGEVVMKQESFPWGQHEELEDKCLFRKIIKRGPDPGDVLLLKLWQRCPGVENHQFPEDLNTDIQLHQQHPLSRSKFCPVETTFAAELCPQEGTWIRFRCQGYSQWEGLWQLIRRSHGHSSCLTPRDVFLCLVILWP